MNKKILTLIIVTIIGFSPTITEPVQAIENGWGVPSGLAVSAVVRFDYPNHYCSGVLISPSWVLVIAHCVDDYSDRTNPNTRDVYLSPPLPVVRFRGSGDSISVDRVVRADGAETLTNSLALLHLSHPASPWAQPIPLYRGDLPDPEEHMEIWGFGGDRHRKFGGVKIVGKTWRDPNQFWALCLQADPSRLQSGDSGGPVLIIRNGRKEVIGINWNSGCGGCSVSPCGGRAAAAFDIDDNGHSNLVSYPIDQIVHEPMGHGADSLDMEDDGMHEIVFYDANSGELRVMGIGAYTRFHVRLVEQVAPNYQFLEVGDFSGGGFKNEIILYRGDTGELRAYHLEERDGNYYLMPWERYTAFKNPLLPASVTPFGASATTSGDFNGDGTTELALIDRQNEGIHVVNIATGEYLGSTTHPIFGDADIFTSGRFRSSSTHDWIAAYRASDNTIQFLQPSSSADGSITFQHRPGSEIAIPSGEVSQMVRGRYDSDGADDLFVYRSQIPSSPVPLQWFATVYTNVGTGRHTILMDRTLTSRYNMIIPGNFDEDDYDEIALWQRAYDPNRPRQAMSVCSIDGASRLTRLSGRVWNWSNRWWTHMQ